MDSVTEDLQHIKSEFAQFKNRINSDNPIIYADLALCRTEVESWLQEQQERVRLLEEILNLIKEAMGKS